MQHGSDWLADLVERDAQREARAARLAYGLGRKVRAAYIEVRDPIRSKRHTHPERTARPEATEENMR